MGLRDGDRRRRTNSGRGGCRALGARLAAGAGARARAVVAAAGASTGGDGKAGPGHQVGISEGRGMLRLLGGGRVAGGGRIGHDGRVMGGAKKGQVAGEAVHLLPSRR